MKKEYLPSRQFIAKTIIIVILVGIIFGVYQIVSFFKNRTGGEQGKAPTKLLVKDIIQKDSNKNGIPDWEESLWGLDPSKDGPANKDFILAKRKELAQNADSNTTDDGTPKTDNEALSREFFAVIMSLEQTGNLDDTAMQSVSDAIGKKIVAEPIADIYTKSMVVVKEEDPIETIEYYTAYLNLNTKYKDKNIGDELTFIATALKNNDQGALVLVAKIGESYRSFGKDLIKIPVPVNLLSIHLDLANNYEKVAQSIEELSKLLSDPVAGMKALTNYKKYDDALVADIGLLSDNFK